MDILPENDGNNKFVHSPGNAFVLTEPIKEYEQIVTNPTTPDLIAALESVTEADLRELDRRIDLLAMQKEELLRVRKMIVCYLRACGKPFSYREMEKNPGRPRGALAKSQRMAIVKYIAKLGKPARQNDIERDLSIPKGSITYLLNFKWFRKDEFGTVSITTDARREVL